MSDPAALAQRAVLQAALRYPQAAEDHPWEHTVVKVPGKKGKIFIFVDASDGRFALTAKLPSSGQAALTLPFTEPTGYGLGKSGWVSARFDQGEDIPVDLLMAWLDESYRAVAPKKLVKALDGGAPASAARPRPAAKKPRSAARRPAPAAKPKTTRPAAKKTRPAARSPKKPAPKRTPAKRR